MRVLTFLMLIALNAPAVAEEIESVRVRAESDRSRVVFDLKDAVDYRVFEMRNPDRVVIDIVNTRYPTSLNLPTSRPQSTEDTIADGEIFDVLERMRYAARNDKDLRIVLDLRNGINLQHTLLPPRQNYGHRLVIDLYRKDASLAKLKSPATISTQPQKKPKQPAVVPASNESKPVEKQLEPVTSDGAKALAILNGQRDNIDAPRPMPVLAAPQPQISNDPPNALDTTPAAPQVKQQTPSPLKRKPPKTVVVAIDAGHGGHDVGAIGPKGTYEKNIVLEISRELAKEINKQHGMRAVLTRSNDHYVGLRERMQRARREEADLFISIHADAFTDRRVSGSSVYVLSQHGASSEAARWLAENENASDLVGGVTLGDKDDVVKSVLIDLSQTASIDASIDAADTVLGALKKIGKVHKPTVQHAGFMVLKSPDIPSLLVETAFISNPSEENKLRSKAYQRKLARALSDGVFRYFTQNPLPDTQFAENYQRQHKVTNGDTLSEIAEQYAVSMESIKLANEMSRDRVLAGEILTIP